jgi:hypothetical protein
MPPSPFDVLRTWLVRTVDGLAARRRRIRGIPVTVLNSRPDIDTALVCARLDAALGLIETWQPWRFRRLQHDLAGIRVSRFPCRAAYFPHTRTCLVELTFLANPAFSDAQIAASIVHEGVHARLHRAGLRLPPEEHAREERLCRRAELELGLAVPNGEAVVERARQSLSLADDDVAPSIDWDEAARRVAEVDAAARRRQDA